MINFLKFTKVYALLSAIVMILGLYSMFTFGYRYSIDFTGGTLIEYQAPSVIKQNKISVIKKAIGKDSAKIQIHKSTILLRLPSVKDTEEPQLRERIANAVSAKSLIVQRLETVGPSVSREIVRTTAIASLLASIGILLYMTFAFKKITHGLAAVLAMFHDFLILMGTYSIMSHYFGAEFDTLFVTALLTTMSFSVHDTIVVFDKIREYSKVSVKPIATLANQALTETMVRSINNSLTIMLMLIPLAVIGGESIRFFALALLIGTITGTYSSPFVATPLLVFFEKLRLKR